MSIRKNMLLTDLIPGVTGKQASIAVSGLTQDSREVVPGDLFFARSGAHHRGTDFIKEAAEKGAVAAVADRLEWSGQTSSIPVIPVSELDVIIGDAARRYYETDAEPVMSVIGVTGTNGKTSCSHFLAQALNRLGKHCAVIGTIGNGFPQKLQPSTHTTPDAIRAHQLLSELKDQGADCVVMEVSSHALDQERVAGIRFTAAAFTNLSRDHLDYHQNMQAYGAAKAKLFLDKQVPLQVVNLEDPFGAMLAKSAAAVADQLLTYGIEHPSADLNVIDMSLAATGMRLSFKTPWGPVAFETALIGRYNISNLLLVAGVLGLMGYRADEISIALAGVTAVAGRMERVAYQVDEPTVLIDYAHTPDALYQALKALSVHKSGKGQLWCVFGCGGDRDAGKRPEMGRIAAELADQLVVTSDNPRTESPDQILTQIVAGIPASASFKVEVDRAKAIEMAVMQASSDDIVLIAGKGHEDYQEIHGKRHPFSDQKYALAALRRRAAS
ncbi:UDP-N-acetylmuramoyl-L-alanyl-D-glutamate--2,6-diaminopimelate ligase [Nitrincola alkalilacustris]|uniref:UDP-N-acetylmuramoyl-L-alanyl-D-glutamate--2, 6-diaminopimelate ligase n=1 Tax=Nitrincola alkalilacustris TaxID=1571224 RepID=UPI00124EA947|nr:UDP-N-acetylmuramoyl-L-alanyl-D-glutamate--2,6-diaminopimelate ligase [Nitrincola alkalilacustris]